MPPPKLHKALFEAKIPNVIGERPDDRELYLAPMRVTCESKLER